MDTKCKDNAYKAWLSMQKKEYGDSFKVYSPSEPLYHVSPASNIYKFFPKIPVQLKEGEDNTVARICTSVNILDALIGMLDTSNASRLKDGNLTVYEFKPHISLRPSKKLLPNNTELNERWIVGYDPTYTDYDSTIVGEIKVETVLSDNGIISVEGIINGYVPISYHNDKSSTGPSEIRFYICIDTNDEYSERILVQTMSDNGVWR